MTTTTQLLAQVPWTAPRQGVWELIRAELTLAPERTARMVRMTVLAMLVVLISMALRVPESAISAYMIFFVIRDDAPATVKSGIGLIVAVTGAVLVGLVVLVFTDGQPMLRLAAAVVLSFGAMYAARRSPKLGQLGFAIGFVVTMFLVYVDSLQTPEVLTRVVCWLWVVIAYPAALVVVCEGTFGDDPEVLLRGGLSARLLAVANVLEATPEESGPARRRVERLERMGTGALLLYAGRGPAALGPLRTAVVGEVQTLLLVAGQLPLVPATGVRGSLRQAAAACRRLGEAILGAKGVEVEAPPAPALEDLAEDEASAAEVLSILASVRALTLKVSQLREPSSIEAPSPTPAVPPDPAELESERRDAVHFALKVTLAAMSAYILYTALDWRGIHTAMITCFFVAQESVGATIHKFTLRILGAVVGGAMGIVSLILILPRIDSGGALALLLGAVTLLAGWLATGSQRIVYAGWQVAFAFYITVLHGGFDRTTKMVVARDRMLGVILGNVLMSIVFTHLWPVRVGPRVADGIARALEALADLISVEGAAPDAEARSTQLEQAFLAGLDKAEQSAFLARFEPGERAGSSLLPALDSLFIPARALSLSASSESQVVQSLPEAERWRVETVATLRHALALRLRTLAADARAGRPLQFHEGKDAFEGPHRSFDAVGDAALKNALAPLRMRLGWLGRIGERLEVLLPPVGSPLAPGAGR
jgi:multidrug resistance protein MdtO